MTGADEQARALAEIIKRHTSHGRAVFGDLAPQHDLDILTAAQAILAAGWRLPSSQPAGSEAMAVLREQLKAVFFTAILEASRSDRLRDRVEENSATAYAGADGVLALPMIAAALSATAPPDGGDPTPGTAQGVVEGWTLAHLREANRTRQSEWCPDQQPDLSFRGNELAGEVGEACNVIKKLERERQGWAGSRATVSQLAEELADVVICADLVAMLAGVDLYEAVQAKFDATSIKVGLNARLRTASPAGTAPDPQGEAEVRRKVLEEAAQVASNYARQCQEQAADVTWQTGMLLERGAKDAGKIATAIRRLIDTPASTGAGETQSSPAGEAEPERGAGTLTTSGSAASGPGGGISVFSLATTS